MRRDDIITQQVDTATIFIYLALVLAGLLSIYSVGHDQLAGKALWDFSGGMTNAQRQLMFMGLSAILVVGIMVVDLRFFDAFAYLLYAIALLLLLLVPIIGKEVGGNKSWLGVGSFGIQPSEFAKTAAALAIAKFLGSVNFKIENRRHQAIMFGLMLVPMGLTLLQKDFGTALVFAVFLLVFFREGMSPFLIIIGLVAAFIFVLALVLPSTWYLHGTVLFILLILGYLSRKKWKRILVFALVGFVISAFAESVDYTVNNLLKPHHRNRVRSLVNPDADPMGYGWNVTQSKIAIGSGGFSGKGFLEGTQTKGDFVPKQDTDFIFCTIGEEHGWIGSVVIIGLFVALLLRLVYLAERQKQRFARVIGYSAVSLFFFHFLVNIGMTIGLFPVIGIPLPFFSYGGSAFISFTALLFIFLKLDSHRSQMLQRI